MCYLRGLEPPAVLKMLASLACEMQSPTQAKPQAQSVTGAWRLICPCLDAGPNNHLGSTAMGTRDLHRGAAHLPSQAHGNARHPTPDLGLQHRSSLLI